MDRLFNTDDDLNIAPSRNSSQNDFDFFNGKWKIHNRKLKTRLNNCQEWTEFVALSECRRILGGFGNTDSFVANFDGVSFEAITLRLFNPKTRLWSIYWADSEIVVLDVPQIGSFDGTTGEFFARDVWKGTAVIVKFHWDKTNTEKPVWSQAFSADDGETWEWNWHMTFSRQSENEEEVR